jgi:hypothetical protein
VSPRTEELDSRCLEDFRVLAFGRFELHPERRRLLQDGEPRLQPT